jgi:hypothetical protein
MHQCPNCNEEHCWIGNLDSNNIKENESVCCNCGKRFTNREIDVYNACLLEGATKMKKEKKKPVLTGVGEKKLTPKEQRVKNKERKLREFMKKYCPDVKQLMFNNPQTSIVLKDGRKATVEVRHGDKWCPEKGMLYAYIKASKKFLSFPSFQMSFGGFTPLLKSSEVLDREK